CLTGSDRTKRRSGLHREDDLSFDDAEAARLGDRLGPRARVELAQDRRDMVSGRLLRDDEPPGDLGVPQTLGEELEHLELARGQPGGVVPGRGPGSLADVAHATPAQRPRYVARGRPGAETLELREATPQRPLIVHSRQRQRRLVRA